MPSLLFSGELEDETQRERLSNVQRPKPAARGMEREQEAKTRVKEDAGRSRGLRRGGGALETQKRGRNDDG